MKSRHFTLVLFIFCICDFVLFSCVYALADNLALDRSVERLKRNHKLIEQKLKTLGVTPTRDSFAIPLEGFANEGAVNNETQKPNLLLKTHDIAPELLLGVGAVLYGRTLNRLVIGSEASPALIILDPGQGAFSDKRVIGHARASGTNARVAIEFEKLALGKLKTLPIKALALDHSGAFGIEAQVFSSKALTVAGAMASSFISGAAASGQTLNGYGPYGAQPTPGSRNAILQGLAQTGADQSKRLIEDATSEKPILIIEPGTLVSIYFEEELRR